MIKVATNQYKLLQVTQVGVQEAQVQTYVDSCSRLNRASVGQVRHEIVRNADHIITIYFHLISILSFLVT
jgi:hypothetical protein